MYRLTGVVIVTITNSILLHLVDWRCTLCHSLYVMSAFCHASNDVVGVAQSTLQQFVHMYIICPGIPRHENHTHCFPFHTDYSFQILSGPSLAAKPTPHDVMAGTVHTRPPQRGTGLYCKLRRRHTWNGLILGRNIELLQVPAAQIHCSFPIIWEPALCFSLSVCVGGGVYGGGEIC